VAGVKNWESYTDQETFASLSNSSAPKSNSDPFLGHRAKPELPACTAHIP